METASAIFDLICRELGTLMIPSTRSNMDTLTECMNLCVRGKAELQQAMAQQQEKDKTSNTEDQ